MDNQAYFELLQSGAGVNDLPWPQGHEEQHIDLEGHEEHIDLEESQESTPRVKANAKKARASKASASKRQKNFTKAEDLTLCDAYLEITTDPVIGIDQSRDCYWKRINAYFHANKTEDSDRTLGSLQHRWAVINEQVSKFCACYAQVIARNQSGMTRDNKLHLPRKGQLVTRGLKKQYNELKKREEERLVEERNKLAIKEKKVALEEEKIQIMRMAEERLTAAEESKIMSMDISGMGEDDREMVKERQNQDCERYEG
ncbi:unnamed protein product [Alopecurus aequalis]